MLKIIEWEEDMDTTNSLLENLSSIKYLMILLFPNPLLEGFIEYSYLFATYT